MADPDRIVLDDRWQQEFGRRDRLLFDHYCGAINESWGYSRDCFHTSEIREFDDDLSGAAVKLLGFAPRMSRSEVPLARAPLLGEHTYEVLAAELGMAEEELRALGEKGVLRQAPAG